MSYQPSKTLHESIDYVSFGTEYLEFNSYKIIDYRNSIIDEISKFYNININIINEICNKIGYDLKEHKLYPSPGSYQIPSAMIKTIIDNRNTWSSNNCEWLANSYRIIKYNEKKCNDLVNLINENSIKLIEFNDKINKIVEYINMLRTRYSEISDKYCCSDYKEILNNPTRCIKIYGMNVVERCRCTVPNKYKSILKIQDIINNHYEEIINLQIEYIKINDIILSPNQIIKNGTITKIMQKEHSNADDIYNELFFGITGIKQSLNSKGPKEDKINKMIEVSNNYINHDEAKAIITMFAYESSENPTNTNLSFINKPPAYIFYHWQQYFNSNDGNTLLALQVMNKFATEHKIRVEDTISVFREYMKK